MRDAASVLARGDPDHVSEEAEKYHRNVDDHLVQLVGLVETSSDLTGGAGHLPPPSRCRPTT